MRAGIAILPPVTGAPLDVGRARAARRAGGAVHGVLALEVVAAALEVQLLERALDACELRVVAVLEQRIELRPRTPCRSAKS